MTEMRAIPLKHKVRAIVQFGPATPTSGMRPGEYYQVTIDPNMTSPKGDYLRLGLYPGDEINGWQRIDGLTLCEVLGECDDVEPRSLEGYVSTPNAEVTMRAVI